ncbi:MAG: polysaccharide deacetylase family protein [Granulosicoccus sp.]
MTTLFNTVHHNRYAHSNIVDRPTFDWPGNARLAVYLGVNLECFSFGSGLGAQLCPGGSPDILNHGWRDYGNRVGVWRMLDLFDRLELPCTVLANSLMYHEAPGVIEAFRVRGDDIIAHGRTNAERQDTLSEDVERVLIKESTDTMVKHEGKHPRGWLGPWIAESRITPDLLEEAGYDYVLDWSHDDQPTWLKTRGGKLLSVPYPQELNDIPQIVGRKLESPAFRDMIMDAFDVMLEESTRHPLVMGIALHPYIMGYPHRLKSLEQALRYILQHFDERVWISTASAINEHYRRLDEV